MLAALDATLAASRAALALASACSASSLAFTDASQATATLVLRVACSRATASPFFAFFLPGFYNNKNSLVNIM